MEKTRQLLYYWKSFEQNLKNAKVGWLGTKKPGKRKFAAFSESLEGSSDSWVIAIKWEKDKAFPLAVLKAVNSPLVVVEPDEPYEEFIYYDPRHSYTLSRPTESRRLAEYHQLGSDIVKYYGPGAVSARFVGANGLALITDDAMSGLLRRAQSFHGNDLSIYVNRGSWLPSTSKSDSFGGQRENETQTSDLDTSDSTVVPGIPKRKISLVELEARLARQREIGAQGEDAAFRYECDRLQALGCDNPVAHIEQLSKHDVGAGYDLRSTFNGSKRCIEVKASVNRGDSFFISENERKTLAELGSDAYLYRVLIDTEDAKNSRVVQEIPNPMGPGKLELEPVAYKATVIGLAGGKEPD
jgi:hypothetical protein